MTITRIVRRGVAELIDNERDMTVCGQEGTAAGGLRLIQRIRPDVAVVDLSLGLGSGLQLVKQLAGSHSDVRVLILSMHDETLYAERALAAGAHGYVMKDEAVPTLISAIRAVARGEPVRQPADVPAHRKPSLGARRPTGGD